MSVCEQMAEVRETRKREAQARADELARKDANGKKVDPIEALDTLIAAGLPDDWLEKRVQHYKTRAGQLAIAAQQPEAERAKAQAQAELAEAEAEIKTAQQHFADRWNPAQQALELANRQLEQIQRPDTRSAGRHVQGSCNPSTAGRDRPRDRPPTRRGERA